MRMARVFSIDQNTVSLYYNKDIELLSKDLITIGLEVDWSVR